MLERLRRLVVWLYPRAWRDRYGEEFTALLEDAPARWRDLPDLTKGAFAMQLQLQSWKTVALMGAVGLIVAAGVTLRQPPSFTSVARIHATDARVVPFLSIHALSRPALKELVDNFKLYESDRLRLPMEDILNGMRHDIRVEVDPDDAGVFTIQFHYPDAEKARAVTSGLVAQYMFENQLQSRKSNLVASTLEQVRPPDLSGPQRSYSRWILLWGLALGLLAGLIVRQPLRRTLKLAGFTLAGLIIAAAPFYLIQSRFMSTATVVAKGAIGTPQVDVKVDEIPMPGDSPRVYSLSAVKTDQRQAQRALQDAIRALDPEIKDVIAAPTYPSTPVSPNRLMPAFCGALAGVLYGMRRTRRQTVNA